MKLARLLGAVCIGLILCGSATAQINFNGLTDGDLSGSFGSPTQLTLGVGTNTITGNVGSNTSTGATNGTDADYFTFSLAAGETADSISILRSGPGTRSFIGYRNDVAFTGQSSTDLDANTLFSNGFPLIPGILLASPLTEGDHSFWIQETGGSVDYTISFNVTSSSPAICGDVDMNGAVNFLDINPFIAVLSANGFQAEADCNMDGSVTFLDIAPFIAALSGP